MALQVCQGKVDDYGRPRAVVPGEVGVPDVVVPGPREEHHAGYGGEAAERVGVVDEVDGAQVDGGYRCPGGPGSAHRRARLVGEKARIDPWTPLATQT